MRKWYLSLPVFGCVTLMASAQVVQVQVQPAGQAQAAPVQIQVQGNVQILPAQADVALLRPGVPFMPANRLAPADATLVGRVVAIEPMDVDASPAAGQPNVKYRVAVVQVTEAIHGIKKDQQMIRVAFIPQGGVAPGGINGGGIQIQPLPAVQPAIQPFPGGRRPFIPSVTLAVGQDGIFMLNKHHKENFYLVANYNSFINRQNNPNFDNEVKLAKQLAKVMADPAASLKAEAREDRYVAAAVLITKYRQPANPQNQPLKAMPIDAAESKLILKSLSEGDWTLGRFNATIPNPFELFNQMGINQKDGYNPVNVRNQQDIATAMQKWLSENNDKYVIQKLVPDANAKPGVIQPGVDPVPLPVPVPNPKIRPVPGVKIQPIKKINVKPLPAPVPAPQPVPAPVEVRPAPAPAQDLPAPAPARRDQ